MASYKEVPILAAFKDHFLNDYARANRQKPSGISNKEIASRVHLIPLLGTKRLGEITNADIQQVKAYMAASSPKTVNNALTGSRRSRASGSGVRRDAEEPDLRSTPNMGSPATRVTLRRDRRAQSPLVLPPTTPRAKRDGRVLIRSARITEPCVRDSGPAPLGRPSGPT